MYVVVFPAGITGFDWIWLAIGVAFDLFSWSGWRLHRPQSLLDVPRLIVQVFCAASGSSRTSPPTRRRSTATIDRS